jgi:photosystem II oxygen-evolving enhancer protein 3
MRELHVAFPCCKIAVLKSPSPPRYLAAAPQPRAARAAVVVRASAEETRRAVLGGLVAGVAALTATSANAAIDIIDDRKVRSTGFDIIYEARDLDLPQGVRDGLTQARENAAFTKQRIAESEKRIDSELEPFLQKAYWTEAREQLRRQVGTLNFDIDSLAAQLPKDARKEALALKQTFKSEVADLDFAIRKKDKTKALKELADTKAALDAVLAKVA